MSGMKTHERRIKSRFNTEGQRQSELQDLYTETI